MNAFVPSAARAVGNSANVGEEVFNAR